MGCDGKHLKALIDVLNRLGAALFARGQLAGERAPRRDAVLDESIGRMVGEHEDAKVKLRACDDCLAVWDELEPR